MLEVPIPYSERVGPSKLNVFKDGSIFLQSMIWTVLLYNPVRILGMVGLLFMIIAGSIGLGIVAVRLQGINYLGTFGITALFGGLLSGVIGISIFSLGVTFNYLVSLFYKQPIRQGLFGRPIFSIPLENHFWWVGLLGFIGGLCVAGISIALSINGWEITRLWFYLIVSTAMSLVGVQLIISWISLKVLNELSQRDILVEKELTGEA